MKTNLVLDERELDELHHALYYRAVLHHGTIGHNQLMLLGKIAESLGFGFDQTGVFVFNGEDVREELTVYSDY
jgi:hypothetical protein